MTWNTEAEAVVWGEGGFRGDGGRMSPPPPEGRHVPLVIPPPQKPFTLSFAGHFPTPPYPGEGESPIPPSIDIPDEDLEVYAPRIVRFPTPTKRVTPTPPPAEAPRLTPPLRSMRTPSPACEESPSLLSISSLQPVEVWGYHAKGASDTPVPIPETHARPSFTAAQWSDYDSSCPTKDRTIDTPVYAEKEGHPVGVHTPSPISTVHRISPAQSGPVHTKPGYTPLSPALTPSKPLYDTRTPSPLGHPGIAELEAKNHALEADLKFLKDQLSRGSLKDATLLDTVMVLENQRRDDEETMRGLEDALEETNEATRQWMDEATRLRTMVGSGDELKEVMDGLTQAGLALQIQKQKTGTAIYTAVRSMGLGTISNLARRYFQKLRDHRPCAPTQQPVISTTSPTPRRTQWSKVASLGALLNKSCSKLASGAFHKLKLYASGAKTARLKTRTMRPLASASRLALLRRYYDRLQFFSRTPRQSLYDRIEQLERLQGICDKRRKGNPACVTDLYRRSCEKVAGRAFVRWKIFCLACKAAHINSADKHTPDMAKLLNSMHRRSNERVAGKAFGKLKLYGLVKRLHQMSDTMSISDVSLTPPHAVKQKVAGADPRLQAMAHRSHRRTVARAYDALRSFIRLRAQHKAARALRTSVGTLAASCDKMLLLGYYKSWEEFLQGGSAHRGHLAEVMQHQDRIEVLRRRILGNTQSEVNAMRRRNLAKLATAAYRKLLDNVECRCNHRVVSHLLQGKSTLRALSKAFSLWKQYVVEGRVREYAKGSPNLPSVNDMCRRVHCAIARKAFERLRRFSACQKSTRHLCHVREAATTAAERQAPTFLRMTYYSKWKVWAVRRRKLKLEQHGKDRLREDLSSLIEQRRAAEGDLVAALKERDTVKRVDRTRGLHSLRNATRRKTLGAAYLAWRVWAVKATASGDSFHDNGVDALKRRLSRLLSHRTSSNLAKKHYVVWQRWVNAKKRRHTLVPYYLARTMALTNHARFVRKYYAKLCKFHSRKHPNGKQKNAARALERAVLTQVYSKYYYRLLKGGTAASQHKKNRKRYAACVLETLNARQRYTALFNTWRRYAVLHKTPPGVDKERVAYLLAQKHSTTPLLTSYLAWKALHRRRTRARSTALVLLHTTAQSTAHKAFKNLLLHSEKCKLSKRHASRATALEARSNSRLLKDSYDKLNMHRVLKQKPPERSKEGVVMRKKARTLLSMTERLWRRTVWVKLISMVHRKRVVKAKHQLALAVLGNTRKMSLLYYYKQLEAQTRGKYFRRANAVRAADQLLKATTRAILRKAWVRMLPARQSVAVKLQQRISDAMLLRQNSPATLAACSDAVFSKRREGDEAFIADWILLTDTVFSQSKRHYYFKRWYGWWEVQRNNQLKCTILVSKTNAITVSSAYHALMLNASEALLERALIEFDIEQGKLQSKVIRVQRRAEEEKTKELTPTPPQSFRRSKHVSSTGTPPMRPSREKATSSPVLSEADSLVSSVTWEDRDTLRWSSLPPGASGDRARADSMDSNATLPMLNEDMIDAYEQVLASEKDPQLVHYASQLRARERIAQDELKSLEGKFTDLEQRHEVVLKDAAEKSRRYDTTLEELHKEFKAASSGAGMPSDTVAYWDSQATALKADAQHTAKSADDKLQGAQLTTRLAKEAAARRKERNEVKQTKLQEAYANLQSKLKALEKPESALLNAEALWKGSKHAVMQSTTDGDTILKLNEQLVDERLETKAVADKREMERTTDADRSTNAMSVIKNMEEEMRAMKALREELDGVERRAVQAEEELVGLSHGEEDALRGRNKELMEENTALKEEVVRLKALLGGKEKQVEAVRPVVEKMKEEQRQILEGLAEQRQKTNDVEVESAKHEEVARMRGERNKALEEEKQVLAKRVKGLEEDYTELHHLVLTKSVPHPVRSPARSSPRRKNFPPSPIQTHYVTSPRSPASNYETEDEEGIYVGLDVADALHIGGKLQGSIRYEGVRVVSARCPAAPAVRSNDVILTVDKMPTPTIAHFRFALKGCGVGRSIRLGVRRVVNGTVKDTDVDFIPVEREGGKRGGGVNVVKLKDRFGISRGEGGFTPAGVGLVESDPDLASYTPSPRGARTSPRRVLPLRVNPLSVFKKTRSRTPETRSQSPLMSPRARRSTSHSPPRSRSLSLSASPDPSEDPITR